MAARTKETGILLRLPLILLIWGAFSLSMYIPALFALIRDNHQPARSFFYSGTLGLVLVTLLAIVLASHRSKYGLLGRLLSLFVTFSVLPVFLAIPVFDALRNTTFLNAYFDMVSALTTTGADLFRDPDRLSPSIHLWRAQVAWMGGLLMWIAASAILAPLSLGGFEITARGQPGRYGQGRTASATADPHHRLILAAKTLAPIYCGLTLVAWILLMLTGEQALIGLCHAMSVMATSGISPVGGLENSQSGLAGEGLLFLFMFFALSRLTFSNDTATEGFNRLDRDPEFRIGLLFVIGVPVFLIARQWLGAYDVDATGDPIRALHAAWGTMFTVMSFLTTTGFESADWNTARSWSGLGTPGLILMGLALIGGGVATTAGGVKLLRVYALYLHGLREMERLVHPSSVPRRRQGNRRIGRDGAFLAWIFFMMFAISMAVITLVLTAFGAGFEQALVMTIATLSTTGPLIEVAADTPIMLIELAPWAKGILCFSMILGRLETLALIALLTPDLWRN